jgi:Ring finger domain
VTLLSLSIILFMPNDVLDHTHHFIKKKKFANINNEKSKGFSSFRVTQSSSFLSNQENDLESNLSFGTTRQPSCAICLDRFKSGEDICSSRNKDCPHEFHLDCIFSWLLQSQDCPCCRRDYITIEADVSETTSDSMN